MSQALSRSARTRVRYRLTFVYVTQLPHQGPPSLEPNGWSCKPTRPIS